jgi:glycogen debranching enzyme
MGHCLWSGIVDQQHAERVVQHLMSSQMWSGWGIRTLASDEHAYDPMSYHRGTVWPHDGALCAAGLHKYGFEAEALQVAKGLLEASDAWNGRLPELFSGLDRDDIGTPVPFPTSCSPQAWSAATPFLLLRTMLGLEPHPTEGLSLDPIEGAVQDDLVLLGLRRLDRRFDVRITGGTASVQAWMDDRE